MPITKASSRYYYYQVSQGKIACLLLCEVQGMESCPFFLRLAHSIQAIRYENSGSIRISNIIDRACLLFIFANLFLFLCFSNFHPDNQVEHTFSNSTSIPHLHSYQVNQSNSNEEEGTDVPFDRALFNHFEIDSGHQRVAPQPQLQESIHEQLLNTPDNKSKDNQVGQIMESEAAEQNRPNLPSRGPFAWQYFQSAEQDLQTRQDQYEELVNPTTFALNDLNYLNEPLKVEKTNKKEEAEEEMDSDVQSIMWDFQQRSSDTDEEYKAVFEQMNMYIDDRMLQLAETEKI